MKRMSFAQVVAHLHPHLSLPLKGEGIEGRGWRSRFRVLAITIAATATICLAGYWEFEQVDSSSLGSYVAIDKASDGAIWLAYVNRDSAIRLAHRDSVWEYEDLDTALVRPMLPTAYMFDDLPFSFDVGPNDIMGVVGLGRLAERRDSDWSAEQLPMPMSGLSFGYDPAGRPSLTFKDSLWQGCLGLKTDSGWDTSVAFHPTEYTWFYMLSRPAWRRDEECALMEADVWSMGGLIEGYGVALYVRDSGVWTVYGKAGGLDGTGYGFAALADSADSIHTFWTAVDPYATNELVCDAVRLDDYTFIGAACLDDSGRVQCAWWARDSLLKFDLLWEPIQVVGSADGVVWCDITTDTLSEPVIAFCRDDGSIWVAHGVHVAGLSGEQRGTPARRLPSEASIVRGVLVLPWDMTETAEVSDRVPRPVLLDISGRKVMNLRPGANDVSSIAPGVYCVRDVARGARGDGQVRKVVIQR
jgi:hypothetical protein